MKNMQKGFTIPLFLIVVVLLIIGGTIYFLTKSNNPVITSITPNSAQVGESVTIMGKGFTSSNNEILFAVTNGKYTGEGIVILNKDNSTVTSSADGKTLIFDVPSMGYKKIICPANEACLPLPPNFYPGQYSVYVKNSKGTSNKVFFTIK